MIFAAGAACCRASQSPHASSGAKLTIACNGCGGAGSARMSPTCQSTPGCAGCACRLKARTGTCAATSRGNRNRPIWLVAPETRTVIAFPRWTERAL
ncbi:hypothetical protein D3C81_2034480 [compost metagenome]